MAVESGGSSVQACSTEAKKEARLFRGTPPYALRCLMMLNGREYLFWLELGALVPTFLVSRLILWLMRGSGAIGPG
jgi:hypothetical protein